MIFGGEATVERYKGNPRVQAHGPGFSKILLGDDVVDHWEDYIDIMVDSIYLNSGRGCINCSGVWASRHTREIAAALASRMGPVEVKPPDDPAGLAGGLHGAGRGLGGLEIDRSRSARRRGRAHDGPLRAAADRDGARALFATHDHPLQVAAGGDRPQGIHVSVCHGRRVSARADDRVDRADAGLLGDHRSARLQAAVDRRHAHRSLEHRADPDDQARLVAAARGKHRRVFVSGSGVSNSQRQAGERGSGNWQTCRTALGPVVFEWCTHAGTGQRCGRAEIFSPQSVLQPCGYHDAIRFSATHANGLRARQDRYARRVGRRIGCPAGVAGHRSWHRGGRACRARPWPR